MQVQEPLAHRADIDGLRAVAVLAVMLFHLEVPGFDGGFAGVDVFFVISGFLITRFLLRDLEAGRFSALAFYRRRILRILPALFVVVLACALAGWFILLPSEVVRLGESTVAAALSVANFYFLGYDGYQNALTMQVPLLHTWSLSVEEQFYIVYPWLVAFVAWKLRGRYTAVWVALGALSFLLAFVLAQRSANAAFLFSPARAWELLLGGLVALPWARDWRLRAWECEALAAFGLVWIALGVFVYGRLPIPLRLHLLVPCIGTALIILAGMRRRTFVSATLSSGPLVFIGLISYSLYLWHWPLIVFFRAVRPFQPGIAAFVIPASFALAWLSWRLVEQPFRRTKARPRAVFAAAGVAVVLMVLAGASVMELHGGYSRAPVAVRYLDAYNDYRDPEGVRQDRCFLSPRRIAPANLDRDRCLGSVAGKPDYLLVGDSHAAHLWHGFAQALPRVNVQQATASGCKPLLGVTGHAACDAFMEEVLGRVVPERKPHTVILAARWSDTDPEDVRRTVRSLLQSARRVVVVGPAVEYQDALPRLMALAEWQGDTGLPSRARRPEIAQRDAALAAALADSGASYVSLHALMCQPGGGCVTATPAGVPVQFDYGHFTREGATWAVRQMRPPLLAPTPP